VSVNQSSLILMATRHYLNERKWYLSKLS